MASASGIVYTAVRYDSDDEIILTKEEQQQMRRVAEERMAKRRSLGLRLLSPLPSKPSEQASEDVPERTEEKRSERKAPAGATTDLIPPPGTGLR